MVMLLYPLRTKILVQGDDLATVVIEEAKKQNIPLENGDIIVISSKVVARLEGRMVKLSEVKPSQEAYRIAKEVQLEPEFVELVLKES
ncbi:MAG: coenzyme F420-0:L-glutamate ligase, partial [Candidatus Freyarchaeota archaeon]